MSLTRQQRRWRLATMALLFAGVLFKLPTDVGGESVTILLDVALLVFTGSVLVYDIATVVRSRRGSPR